MFLNSCNRWPPTRIYSRNQRGKKNMNGSIKTMLYNMALAWTRETRLTKCNHNRSPIFRYGLQYSYTSKFNLLSMKPIVGDTRIEQCNEKTWSCDSHMGICIPEQLNHEGFGKSHFRHYRRRDRKKKKKKYSIIFGLFRACVDGCSCQHRASSYKSTAWR